MAKTRDQKLEVQVAVRISRTLAMWLDRIAGEHGLARSWLIRDAIHRAIQEHRWSPKCKK